MLRSVAFRLEPNREEKCHYNMASLFHGILMERIDPLYGKALHESGLKPYSQFLSSPDEGRSWCWIINFLNDRAVYSRIF